MKINDAIAKRINDLCNDKELAQHLTDGRSKNPKILTIARISNGFGLKLKDFFDDPVFDDIDLED